MKSPHKKPFDSHPGLLLDPDVEQAKIIRPVHTDPFHIAVVASGGFLGTLTRYYIGVLLPTNTHSWPTAIFLINILGAFMLGLLLQTLQIFGPDTGNRRLIRLGFGTGFLGAFTTYSSLAVGADLLIRSGNIRLALTYAVGSVLLGVAASALGIKLATRRRGNAT